MTNVDKSTKNSEIGVRKKLKTTKTAEILPRAPKLLGPALFTVANYKSRTKSLRDTREVVQKATISQRVWGYKLACL